MQRISDGDFANIDVLSLFFTFNIEVILIIFMQFLKQEQDYFPHACIDHYGMIS